MPRQNERKLPNFKGILTIVGIMFIIIGGGMMYAVDIGDDAPWSEFWPGGDDSTTTTTDTTTTTTNTTTTDVANTTTTGTSSTTTEPANDPPTGTVGLRVYGLRVDGLLTEITVTTGVIPGGLIAEGQNFVGFCIEPVVYGDVSMMNGDLYVVRMTVHDIKCLSNSGGSVSLLSEAVMLKDGGTVVCDDTGFWATGRFYRLLPFLPGGAVNMESALMAMGMDQGVDLWNHDIEFTMSCSMTIANYTAVAKELYFLSFWLGDAQSWPGSIHSISLTDGTETILTYAQWLMVIGVGLIAVVQIPWGSLTKKDNRRRM